MIRIASVVLVTVAALALMSCGEGDPIIIPCASAHGGCGSPEPEQSCPGYFQEMSWRCGDHLRQARMGTFCQGDDLMEVGGIACDSCGGETRCDCSPVLMQTCEKGCSDDLDGQASCN